MPLESGLVSRIEGAVIQADGVTITGGGRRLIRSATFSVLAGELVAIAGPNGSGKSLLARALVGIAPAAGRVTVCGLPVARARRRHLIGYLDQGASLYPYLTAAENLQLFAALAGVGRRERAKVAGDLLELVGLPGIARVEASVLSPGQRKRLAIARALVGDPAVLVLDEPLAGLDAEGRRDVADLIGTLAQMGKAVLALTCDPEGLPLDRMLLLMEGRLVGGGRA